MISQDRVSDSQNTQARGDAAPAAPAAPTDRAAGAAFSVLTRRSGLTPFAPAVLAPAGASEKSNGRQSPPRATPVSLSQVLAGRMLSDEPPVASSPQGSVPVLVSPEMAVLLNAIAAHDRHATLDACVTDLIGRRARDIGLESLFRAAKERAPP